MEDRIRAQFVECFGISADIVEDELEYASIPQWDSVMSPYSVINGDCALGEAVFLGSRLLLLMQDVFCEKI